MKNDEKRGDRMTTEKNMKNKEEIKNIKTNLFLCYLHIRAVQ